MLNLRDYNIEVMTKTENNQNTVDILACQEAKSNGWTTGRVCAEGTNMLTPLALYLEYQPTTLVDILFPSNCDEDYSNIYPCQYPEQRVSIFGNTGFCWEITVRP